MKRLTTDTPKDNFETMLNFVYGKDGWAHIRSDGEEDDVLLSKWAAEQCISRDGCEDMFQDGVLPGEVDTTICECMMDSPDCPIALAYCFACQAVHLRDRLKRYEDILFSEDGTELISLERLREIVSQKDNPPLTLEELRAMDAPVWCRVDNCDWLPDGGFWCLCKKGTLLTPALMQYDCKKLDMDLWRLYRRKPEEGTE